MTKFNLSDDSLNRAVDAVAGTPRGQTPVRYAICCRRAGIVCGVADIVDLLTDHCSGPLTLRGKSDGERFEPGEVVLVLEGPFGELVTLETLERGILSLSAGAANIADLVEAGGDSVRIIDASAGRYPPELIGPLAIAAAAGGARGTITRAGHTAVIERFGTGGDQICVGRRSPVGFSLRAGTPDTLAALHAGDSMASAQALHTASPYESLTFGLGFESRERDVTAEAVRHFGSALEAVRLETPANRIHQGGHEKATRTLEMRILSQVKDRRAAQAALDQHGFGLGVTVEALYAVRDLLDSLGSRSTQIMIGGCGPDKLRALRACNAPVDMVETDCWVEFAEFFSELVAVFEEGQWAPRVAATGVEMPDPASLPVVFQK